MKDQKIFFDGEMREVGAVATILRDAGCTTDFIFRHVGFPLGFMDFQPTQTAVRNHEFQCVIERMPKREVLRG